MDWTVRFSFPATEVPYTCFPYLFTWDPYGDYGEPIRKVCPISVPHSEYIFRTKLRNFHQR